ncbi:13461_t:CDS:2, partial [Gigaspora rosea]
MTTENLPRTNNRNNENIQRTSNDINDTSNTNNTNNANNTNINNEEVLSKLAYKFSSSIRLLDLVIKHVYEIKPLDEDQNSLASWKYLEEALLSTRLLNLDALSTLNVARRDEALKSFMPSINQHRKQIRYLEENYRKLWKKGIEKQSFLMMRYTSEGGKRALNEFFRLQTGKRVQEWFTDELPESTTVTLNSGNTVGGRLKEALHTWRRYLPHYWATTIIKKGYYPVWERTPPLRIHIPSQKVQQ